MEGIQLTANRIYPAPNNKWQD